MMPLWPLIVLLPPLGVTLLGGRTAWVWLSLGMGIALAFGLVQYVLMQFAQGQTEPAFRSLVVTNSVDRAFHDTYYVVANISALGLMLVPTVALALLHLIKAHPRRSRIDLALFWAVVALVVLASYGISYEFSGRGMPRRYIDYKDGLQLLLVAQFIANAGAMALLGVAAARPLWSWWRARKAS